MSIKHLDELAQVLHQLIAEHQRACGAIDQFDLRCVDDNFDGAARRDFDCARVHRDAVPVAIGYFQTSTVVVEYDLVSALCLEDFLAGLR